LYKGLKSGQNCTNRKEFSEIRGIVENGKLRIVFFGTPEFAAHSLRKLAGTAHNIVAVVTAADKPSGRGLKVHESAVKKVALELGLPVLQPTNLRDPEFQEQLHLLQTDLGIVIAFRMLPQAVWSMPKLGTFNLHASLLPQYRGAAPINHAIIQGETETGVTTFFLKHEIDTGDIVLQEKVAIEETDDAGTLHNKLMETGSDLVVKTLELVALGNWPETPQNATQELKPAPKLNRNFCEVTHSDTCEHTRNKIRGLCPYPGAWAKSAFGEIKLLKVAKVVEQQRSTDIFTLGGRLFWPCADGSLEILELQPAGKPRMKAADFINGLANKR
jgi:methionyl-tRNA formyltransferase